MKTYRNLTGLCLEKKLKKSAKESCEWRGHDMANFARDSYPNNSFTAICKKCGARVYVELNPMPNSTNIFGRASAVNCMGEDISMDTFARLQKIFKNRGIDLYITDYKGRTYLMGESINFDGWVEIRDIKGACIYARIWYRSLFFQF